MQHLHDIVLEFQIYLSSSVSVKDDIHAEKVLSGTQSAITIVVTRVVPSPGSTRGTVGKWRGGDTRNRKANPRAITVAGTAKNRQLLDAVELQNFAQMLMLSHFKCLQWH